MTPRALFRDGLISLRGADSFDRAAHRSLGAAGPDHPFAYAPVAFAPRRKATRKRTPARRAA